MLQALSGCTEEFSGVWSRGDGLDTGITGTQPGTLPSLLLAACGCELLSRCIMGSPGPSEGPGVGDSWEPGAVAINHLDLKYFNSLHTQLMCERREPSQIGPGVKLLTARCHRCWYCCAIRPCPRVPQREGGRAGFEPLCLTVKTALLITRRFCTPIAGAPSPPEVA